MAKSAKKSRTRWEDPIVAEVRKNREDLFAAAGYDLDVFCKQLQQQERKEAGRLVTLPSRKPERSALGTARGRPNKRIQPPRKKAARG
jgi:hypothetical protein